MDEGDEATAVKSSITDAATAPEIGTVTSITESQGKITAPVSLPEIVTGLTLQYRATGDVSWLDFLTDIVAEQEVTLSSLEAETEYDVRWKSLFPQAGPDGDDFSVGPVANFTTLSGSSEPSTSEPSDSEPSGSEPSGSEPSSSDPSDSASSGSEPSDSSPSGSEPSDSTPSGSEPSDSTPSASEPSDSTPSGSEPSSSEPSSSEPSGSEPSDSSPSGSEPSDSSPSSSEPSGSEPSDECESAPDTPTAPTAAKVCGTGIRVTAPTWPDNTTQMELRRAGSTEVLHTWLTAGGTYDDAIDDVDAGVSRQYQVRACNDTGCSEWSSLSGAVVYVSSTLTLTWQAPASGAGLSGVVELAFSQNQTVTSPRFVIEETEVVATLSGGWHRASIDTHDYPLGLHTIKALGIGTDGCPAVAERTFLFERCPAYHYWDESESECKPLRPSTPTAPTAAKVCGTGIRVTAPTWPDNTTQMELRRAGSTEVLHTWMTAGGTYDDGLAVGDAGVSRQYQVRACNEAGCSDWSSLSAIVVYASTSLALTWATPASGASLSGDTTFAFTASEPVTSPQIVINGDVRDATFNGTQYEVSFDTHAYSLGIQVVRAQGVGSDGCPATASRSFLFERCPAYHYWNESTSECTPVEGVPPTASAPTLEDKSCADGVTIGQAAWPVDVLHPVEFAELRRGGSDTIIATFNAEDDTYVDETAVSPGTYRYYLRYGNSTGDEVRYGGWSSALVVENYATDTIEFVSPAADSTAPEILTVVVKVNGVGALRAENPVVISLDGSPLEVLQSPGNARQFYIELDTTTFEFQGTKTFTAYAVFASGCYTRTISRSIVFANSLLTTIGWGDYFQGLYADEGDAWKSGMIVAKIRPVGGERDYFYTFGTRSPAIEGAMEYTDEDYDDLEKMEEEWRTFAKRPLFKDNPVDGSPTADDVLQIRVRRQPRAVQYKWPLDSTEPVKARWVADDRWQFFGRGPGVWAEFTDSRLTVLFDLDTDYGITDAIDAAVLGDKIYVARSNGTLKVADKDPGDLKFTIEFESESKPVRFVEALGDAVYAVCTDNDNYTVYRIVGNQVREAFHGTGQVQAVHARAARMLFGTGNNLYAYSHGTSAPTLLYSHVRPVTGMYQGEDDVDYFYDQFSQFYRLEDDEAVLQGDLDGYGTAVGEYQGTASGLRTVGAASSDNHLYMKNLQTNLFEAKRVYEDDASLRAMARYVEEILPEEGDPLNDGQAAVEYESLLIFIKAGDGSYIAQLTESTPGPYSYNGSEYDGVWARPTETTVTAT